MKGTLNELIGHVWAVVVASIDMVDTGLHPLTEDRDCGIDIARRSPNLGTSKSQQVKVTPTSGLTQDEVDRIVNEGERHKQADDLRRELAELRNQAETLLYTTEAALDGYANLVEATMLDDARTRARHLRELLERQAEVEAIRDAYQKLEAQTFKIAESLYGGDTGTAAG